MPDAVSTGLREVICRCLAKEPEQRYPRAGEVRAALEILRTGAVTTRPIAAAAASARWWRRAAALLGLGAIAALVALVPGGLRDRLSGTPARPAIRSLAVLPLESLTADASREYFADGMTEALITELSKIGALKVISRTSVMRYKGSRQTAPHIARELGVDALVEGSVLREGDEVRVTVQLIHGASDAHIWAQSYDRKMTGILALYSEVARAIAGQIRVTLTPQERSRLAATRTVDPRAYEQYVLGRHYLNQRTMDGYREATEQLREAIAIDSAYAPAYSALADNYMLLGEQGGLPLEEARARAGAAIRKAVALDPDLADVHTSSGRWKLYYEWDWAGADRAHRRAIELNPGSAMAHQFYGRHLGFAGRFEEAFTEMRRARELDPLSAPIRAYSGQVHLFARQYDEAGRQLDRTLEINPNHALARHNLGELRLAQGRFDEAVRELERSVEISGLQASSHYLAVLGCAYARAQRRSDALRILEELERRRERSLASTFDLANLYTSLGDTEKAIVWLERGIATRDPWLVEIDAWPWFDTLRGDPRFREVRRRVGLPTARAAPSS